MQETVEQEDDHYEQCATSDLPLFESVVLPLDPDGHESPSQTRELQPQTPQSVRAQISVLNGDSTPHFSDSCLTPPFTHDHGVDLTLDDLDVLGLHQASIAHLLERYLSPSKRSGVFCILAQFEDLLYINELLPGLNTGCVHNGTLSSLKCALLAIALQSESGIGGPVLNGDVELLIDTLRVEALKSVPVLTWKSRALNLDQVLVLLFLSHTWCMKESFSEISNRWTSLARVIWNDLQRYSQNWDHPSGVKNSL